ncbi:MAG: acetylglutamate kinase, partial [Candidatus Omnitrophica bacterium]|nr:acetylglutamate kinase [Candidatus Omnitrophota bacterium]
MASFMEEAIKKARVLIEALPYIKKFHNKVIVIKYGGSILSDEKVRKAVLEDIVFLSFMGLRPVLVHGGGPHISASIRQAGGKTEFINGMRVTDKVTLKIVEKELKSINDLIVDEFTRQGAKAAGLNGKDRSIVRVKKKKSKVDLGLVGQVTGVNADYLLKELKNNRILVILPLGSGSDRKIYNVNADEVAAHIASGLSAEKLVLLTNVRGIMRNPQDEHSFISTLNIEEARGL